MPETAVDRLRDAISHDRIAWRRVEVDPTDIDAVLVENAGLRQDLLWAMWALGRVAYPTSIADLFHRCGLPLVEQYAAVEQRMVAHAVTGEPRT